MQPKSPQHSSKEKAYKLDRGRRNIGAGATIGAILSALTFMLFSNWLPEHFFGPAVLAGAAIFGFLFGFVWPIDLEYHNFGDDPDSITPAERVGRLHAGRETPNTED